MTLGGREGICWELGGRKEARACAWAKGGVCRQAW